MLPLFLVYWFFAESGARHTLFEIALGLLYL